MRLLPEPLQSPPLLDDAYDLFDDEDAPRVLELSPFPDRQLSELLQQVKGSGEGGVGAERIPYERMSTSPRGTR
jgi:hypothetical protein